MSSKTGVVSSPASYGVITASGRELPPRAAAVSRVIVYPDFRESPTSDHNHDVALLVLTKPTGAPAISLPAERAGPPSPKSQGVIVGWQRTTGPPAEGRLRGGPKKRALSKLVDAVNRSTHVVNWVISGEGLQTFVLTMLEAGTVVQAPKWCQQNSYTFYAQGDLCTIDPPRYRTGICGGASGGPLLGPSVPGSPPIELGVASHFDGRSAKCSPRDPVIYTRADTISSWVRKWIAVLGASGIHSRPTK